MLHHLIMHSLRGKHLMPERGPAPAQNIRARKSSGEVEQQPFASALRHGCALYTPLAMQKGSARLHCKQASSLSCPAVPQNVQAQRASSASPSLRMHASMHFCQS